MHAYYLDFQSALTDERPKYEKLNAALERQIDSQLL